MADRPDGSWDAPTEHDDQHEVDSGEFGAEDPPTETATESQRARARGDAIANQLASVNRNVVTKPATPPMPLPSTTLPPPVVQRAPAKPSTPSDSVVMLSDGQCGEGNEASKFSGLSLSLNPATEAEANKIFDALKDGGEIGMPLTKTFWSPCFGMVTDRFGVAWMINVVP